MGAAALLSFKTRRGAKLNWHLLEMISEDIYPDLKNEGEGT